MSILNVKKTKQRKYGVEFRRTSLSILQLRAIRDRANTLQQQLLQFSIPINELANALFGQPLIIPCLSQTKPTRRARGRFLGGAVPFGLWCAPRTCAREF
jgi:hypothetical protein